MKKISIGVIGGTHGMGEWFARLLRREGYSVWVCGRKTRLGIKDLARRCNVIVVSVPISATAEVIRRVGPLLSEDKLLMDLTSLKKEPVRLMLAHSKAEVIGCHPLFGPRLHEESGQNVILCPARGTRWRGWLKGVFKKNKLCVWECTPAKHDKMMAVVQGLTHLNTIALGLALANAGVSFKDINRFSTPIFRTKMDIIRKVFWESPEMYIDIISGNRHMRKILDTYQKAVEDVGQKIKSGKKNDLKKNLERAARKFYGRKNQ
jgi:prephenate dehydrogenase